MRLITDWRRAGSSAVLAALVALAGCDSRKAPATGSSAGAGTPTIEPDGGGPPPRQEAEAFLRDLGEGKVGPDRLTPSFRKQVPPPAVEGVVKAEPTEADIREWLERFKGTKFVLAQQEVRFGPAVVFRGRAEAPNRKEAFTLRMVKEGRGYQADWLHRSERFGMEIKPPAEQDLTAAQDTVRNFLDIFLGGDLRQAHALMDPAWKKKLAPPYPADEKAGLTYNPGFLTGVTRAWKRDFTGYSLPKAELGSDKSTATFGVEFQAGERTVSYTVKAAKDPATGQWMIQDLEAVKFGGGR
jgi:hypothetical protein